MLSAVRLLHTVSVMNGHSWYPVPGRLIAGLSIAAVCLPGIARAEEVVVVRAEGPSPARFESSIYPVEIEPHFAFGADNVYGAAGFGGGLRIGIPLIAGFIGRVPDNLALTFGADIVHYDNCYFANDCGANYLMFPVAAQWNLFVARRVSLFGEAGAFVYKGWFDECGPDNSGCAAPSDFGVLPTVAVGVRIHVSRFSALTLRVGYPTTTLGVSFL
jgi:hypothetical protein